MDRVVKKILQLYILTAQKLEQFVGLSQFHNRNKCYKVLTFFLWFIIKTFFVVIYPISCFRVLSFFSAKDSETRVYSRNITFAFNWLLLVFLYIVSFDNFHRGFSEIKRWFNQLIKIQSLKQNLNFLVWCLSKIIVSAYMIKMNYSKYVRRSQKNLEVWEHYLMFFLLIPYIAFALTSNRIFVANTVVNGFLKEIENNIKSNVFNDFQRIKLCTLKYGRLFDFYKNFNETNSFHLLAVLSFCMLNIVYEVCNMDLFDGS